MSEDRETLPPGSAEHRAILGVLMPGFSGTSVPEWLAPHVRDGLGGVCLFAMNTPDLATTRALSEELCLLNPELCIALDEEGGDVSRLQAAAGSSLPGNEALGALDDLETTREAARAIGSLCRAAGVHLAIAPVLDVASNPRNPVISVRSFGSDPAAVGRHGQAFLAGLHDAGPGGCAKHFPGHGDTAVDSHVGLPVVDISPELLATRDIEPFRMVAEVTDAVMTAHISVPALGPDPATLSRWSHDLLRDLGFTGPIITDALGMAAVAQDGVGEACVRALEAGADLLCLDSPQNREPEALFTEAYSAVARALAEGRLRTEDLQACHERTAAMVRTVTERPGWLEDAAADEAAITELGRAIAERALITRGDVHTTGTVWLRDLRTSVNWAAGDLGSVVLDNLPGIRPAADLAEIPEDDTLVLVTRQPLADQAEADQLMAALTARPEAIVLHTGMASAAPQVPRLVCTHGLGLPNLRAAAKAMLPTT